jgi:sec-independent protein translocase protein TatA
MKPGFWEILLIIVLVLILFGHAKVPDIMKNLANGINVFKKELKGSDSKPEDINSKKVVSATKSVDKKTAVKKSVIKKKPAVKKK